VNITNSGVVRSLNSFNDTSEGVTVGGGTIGNSGTIQGSIITGSGGTGVGRGITLAGVDKDNNGNSIPVQGIYADSSITNSGLIKGDSDSGIVVTGSTNAFGVTINNQAGGVIEGDGALAAAILSTNGNNMSITNSGTITATQSGTAIAFGSGSNNLAVTGGSAAIIGNIVGGGGTNIMTVNPGAGHSFSYSGAISNFNSVTIQSGTVTLSGSNAYTGSTAVTGGRLVVTGALNTASVVTVSAGATLGGSGSVGKVGGAGTLSVGDPMIFTVTQVDPGAGMDFDFSFQQAGAPTYSNAAASGNDVLHITGATPFTVAMTGSNSVTIDFSAITGSLADGQTYLGGFFLDSGTSATIGTPAIGYTGTGTFSIVYEGLVNVSSAGFTSGTVGNGTEMEFMVVPEPSTWAMLAIGGAGLLIAARRRRAKA
jgi:hypothetical protein